jgi:AraC family transcriptional regulator, exoenzyme S synthesis regulatory protein ExsA
MTSVSKNKSPSQITYSCYFTRSREGEQFVAEHILSYQLSGTLIMNDGHKEYIFNEGDMRFVKRNRLLKFNKLPPEGGEFRSLSIYLDQETLQNFSLEYGYSSNFHREGDAVLELKPDKFLKSYIKSLLPYENIEAPFNEELIALKLKEAVLVLLQTNPELKPVLFDFTEPGKIDLAAFMNKNFHFNVQLKRFAYLTGRSLATFKRDFQKIFNTSPNRWLQERRLQEAFYLIKEKGKTPSDIYLDLGFEDLSHFSFAFKKTYGVAPSKV